MSGMFLRAVYTLSTSERWLVGSLRRCERVCLFQVTVVTEEAPSIWSVLSVLAGPLITLLGLGLLFRANNNQGMAGGNPFQLGKTTARYGGAVHAAARKAPSTINNCDGELGGRWVWGLTSSSLAQCGLY